MLKKFCIHCICSDIAKCIQRHSEDIKSKVKELIKHSGTWGLRKHLKNTHTLGYLRDSVTRNFKVFRHSYTTDLHNTKTKSKLHKCATEPYLIYGDWIGKMKKVKKSIYIYIYIYTHRYCLQSFLAEIKNLIKKSYILCVLKIEKLTNL